jgi:hypothetical protein
MFSLAEKFVWVFGLASVARLVRTESSNYQKWISNQFRNKRTLSRGCAALFLAMALLSLNTYFAMCEDKSESNVDLKIIKIDASINSNGIAMQSDRIQPIRNANLNYSSEVKSTNLDKILTMGLVSSAIADFQSGLRFKTGEMNPVMGNNKYRQACIVGGFTGFIIYGNYRMRKEGHKWIPRIITGMAIGFHTYAAVHNHEIK